MQPNLRDQAKKEILAVFRKYDILEDNETGKIIFHVSTGGIARVTKPDKDVLK